MDDPWLGRRIGNYDLDALLGRGGMASVYRATHAALGTPHAVKILEPFFARHEDVRARFLREGRVQAQFKHPGIARVTDTLSDPAALVMELLEGESLRELLQRGPIPAAAAAILIDDIAEALSYAHARGVIHRDIKPDNIFLAERADGTLHAVLLDFGIARMEELTSLTQAGVMIGTPKYMSPEQMEDPRKVDARSDVFALAVVLFELLTGQTPHPGKTSRTVTLAILSGRFGRASPLSDAPPALDAVIERALQPEAAKRYPTIEAFATAVREVMPAPDEDFLSAGPPRDPHPTVDELHHAPTWPPISEEEVRVVLAERAVDGGVRCPRCGAPNGTERIQCGRCGEILRPT